MRYPEVYIRESSVLLCHFGPYSRRGGYLVVDAEISDAAAAGLVRVQGMLQLWDWGGLYFEDPQFFRPFPKGWPQVEREEPMPWWHPDRWLRGIRTRTVSGPDQGWVLRETKPIDVVVSINSITAFPKGIDG